MAAITSSQLNTLLSTGKTFQALSKRELQIAMCELLWQIYDAGSLGTNKTLYGEADQPGYTTGNLPTLTPSGDLAIFIDNAGRQYQYFDGSWH